MSKQKTWFKIIFFFFLIFWLILLITKRYSGHVKYFTAWVLEKGTYDWYAYPLLRAIGEAGYQAIGYSFFFILPFLTFFIGLLFVLFLALDFGYCNKWLLLFLFLTAWGIGETGFFTHDFLMYFLVCIYSFFYFRYVYKRQGHYVILLFLNALMFFCRESAVIVMPLTYLALLKPRPITFPKFPGCLALIAPTFKAPDVVGKTLYDLNDSITEGVRSVFSFHPANWWKYFNFPIFCLSFVAFFKKPDLHLLALVGLTFVYVYSINSNPLFSDSVMRYSLALVPLHLFYLKNLFGEKVVWNYGKQYYCWLWLGCHS